ncbi:pentatricopeptide repeat-containing protein At4g02750-like, partial [Oryza brachyantha]
AALGRALCSAECAGAVSWSNRLMAEHLRARRLEAAREVFDGMPRRDVVSWNTLMAVHARSGAHGRAAGAFLEMRRQGFRPDHTSFSTLLSCCARLEALELGRCVHGLAFKTRSSGNVFVGASLITMYANCGLVSCLEQVLDGVDSPNAALWNALLSGLVMNHCVANACKVFDQMPVRNVVSWTAMIKGYLTAHKVGMAFQLFKLMPVKNSVSWCVMIGGFVTHERFSEAVELFISLMRNGDEVTNVILVKILNAFAGMKSIRGGRCIHGFAVKSGFVYDPVLEASLVLMYCKLLDISEARLEFDKMEGKHVASWNAMLCGYIYWAKIDEARNLFDSMTNRDKISWNSMINGYINHGRIADATEVYSKMTEKSLEAATALMSCFIDNGMLDKAQDIFYNMPQTDVISCTALLFGYVKGGHMDDALDLFHRMHRRTVVTYNVMISGLLHQGKVTEAYKLFNETPRRDSLTWRCLVSGLATNGLIHEALQFYRRMVLSNIRPNESVVSCIMSCLSNYSMMVHGQQFHAITIKIGLDSHVLIQNSLISLYCKCGEMIIAQSIFDLMAKRDKVTWNTMIHGYALNNLGQNAVGMFENMKKAQVDPDDITFLGVLSACNHMSLLEEAKYFFNVMAYTYRILPNIMHYACMVDLFCRKGMIKEAEGLVKSMPFEPDSAIWTSLLSGCRLTGNDKLAEHAASQLIAIDPSTKMPYLHLISVHGLNNKSSVIDSLRSQIKSTATEKDVGYSWI